MKLVYIASPNCGAMLQGRPRAHFIRLVGALHAEHRDCAFLAPQLDAGVLATYLERGDEAVWGLRAAEMLARSDELWVVTYKDWDTIIVGLQREHAASLGKPVRFVNHVTHEVTLQ